MSNEEYAITTNIAAPAPANEHRELGQQLYESAFGFADHIVEGRSTFLTKDVNGNTNFTVVDFDRNREQQIRVTQRTLEQQIYAQLSESFDKMAEQFDRGQITDEQE